MLMEVYFLFLFFGGWGVLIEDTLTQVHAKFTRKIQNCIAYYSALLKIPH